MGDVREKKKAWRKLVADVFCLTPPEVRRERDAALCRNLGLLLPRPEGRMLLGYAALPDEADVMAFFLGWLAGGGRLALPVWEGGCCMTLRRVARPGDELRAGRAGIPEPCADCPEVAPAELAVVVAPGRAFSESRQRIGRGAGCYDALLDGAGVLRIGVAYDFQVFPEVPCGAHDVPMDVVVTPGRVIDGRPGRREA